MEELRADADFETRIAIDDAVPGKFDVLLTTYEMLSKDHYFFGQRFFWNYVILDEAHRLKNEQSLVFKSAGRLRYYNCIMLSGTALQVICGPSSPIWGWWAETRTVEQSARIVVAAELHVAGSLFR